jgi:hypothetical protein
VQLSFQHRFGWGGGLPVTAARELVPLLDTPPSLDLLAVRTAGRSTFSCHAQLVAVCSRVMSIFAALPPPPIPYHVIESIPYPQPVGEEEEPKGQSAAAGGGGGVGCGKVEADVQAEEPKTTISRNDG